MAVRVLLVEDVAELRSVLATARQAHDQQAFIEQPQFGDLPLAVLTSHAYGAKWIGMQREIVKRSRQSFQRITDDRSHNIHMRHPDLVVDAIRETHEQARSRRANR